MADVLYNQVCCVTRFRGKGKRQAQLKHMRSVAIAVVYFESKASIHILSQCGIYLHLYVMCTATAVHIRAQKLDYSHSLAKNAWNLF